MKIDIANVLVDNISKAEVLQSINEFVKSGKPHYIVTIYSEFIVFAQKDAEYLKILNQADLSLPDGIGILWAAKYLGLAANNALDCVFQIVYTGAAIIFNPSFVHKPIPEKISGSQLIWDIAQLANENKHSLALVGGTNDVARKAADAVKKIYPDVRINLALSDMPFDAQTARKINESNSDILCIAASPPMQEKWIAENIKDLNVKVAVGLGGTFDYLSGKRSYAPEWMINLGLEWLYRLLSQPWRIKRMWNAIVVFISIIYKFKLQRIHDKS